MLQGYEFDFFFLFCHLPPSLSPKITLILPHHNSFLQVSRPSPQRSQQSAFSSTTMNSLTIDDHRCIEILHTHGVDSHKLEKMLDQSVNQADTVLAEYVKSGDANRMPAQLAKAFLGGVFSDTVAHLNETELRELHIPPPGNPLEQRRNS